MDCGPVSASPGRNRLSAYDDREVLVHPHLPLRFGAGHRGRRLITVQIETDRQVDLTSHGVGNEMSDTGRRLVKSEEQLFLPRGLARPFHDSRERWRPL